MAIIIVNDANHFNLALKVGDQYIRIPGPASWPHDNGEGKSNIGKGRFLAALIDTGSVLKANGFKPDTPFTFVVNGTALNDNNTRHIATGKSSAGDLSQDNSISGDSRTTGNGTWLGYKFRNIVVSRDQIPSLSDYLLPTKTLTNQNGSEDSSQTAFKTQNTHFLPGYDRGDIPQVTQLEEPSPQTNRKYIEALNSPDPAVRADAIENLVINGYNVPNVIQTSESPGMSADKNAKDNTSDPNDKYLDSPKQLGDSLPQTALSNIALHDKNPSVRIQALDQLAERFGQQASSTFKEAVHDSDPRVARMADALMIDIQEQ